MIEFNWRIYFALLACLTFIACERTYPNFTKDSPTETFNQNKKVLFIGMDGMRQDAIHPEITPTLDSLARREDTRWTKELLIEEKTVSGPNWTSMLTGVHFTKHWVRGNDFYDPLLDEYPSVFCRLESSFIDFRSASAVHWEPINRIILRNCADDKFEGNDQEVAEKAMEWLSAEDCPNLTFLHFDDIDAAGHSEGFDPSLTSYRDVISSTDDKIKSILEVISNRPSRDSEDWLILVSTDHGGLGTSHSDGKDVPEIRNGFLILQFSGSSTSGEFNTLIETVDIPVTVLSFFGFEISPDLDLDGKSLIQ